MSRTCTWWCENREDGHFIPGSPCERSVSGVTADHVPQHGHHKTELWVAAVRDMLAGERLWGVQICVNVDNGAGGWREDFVKTWLRSGDARTLAAQLLAAADLVDGVAAARPGKFGGDW